MISRSHLAFVVAIALVGFCCSNKEETTEVKKMSPVMSKADTQMTVVLNELAAMKPKPIVALPPHLARLQRSPSDAVLQVLQERGNVTPEPQPVGQVEMRQIPGPGGTQIPVRIYSPRGDGPFPVIVYYHGGGWVIANLDTYDASCRALCNQASAVVVSVDYRQAPEHKFPAAHEDSYAAFQHIAGNAQQFRGDPSSIAVAGESAGGNLATAVCIMAKQRNGKMPIHQALVYPITSYAFDTPSYQENANAMPLDAAMMRWFFRHYLNSPSDGENVIVSPLRASGDQLRGLPPATVVTAEIDPLRSEGIAYAQKLKSAGIDVQARDFPGVTHEFFGMGDVVDQARQAQRFVGDRLKQSFQGGGRGMAMRSESVTSAGHAENKVSAGIQVIPEQQARQRADQLEAVKDGPGRGKRDNKLEVVALFDGKPMPTGLTVSRQGRIFLSFPRWGDPVEHTAVELRGGQLVPFPDARTNAFQPGKPNQMKPAERLVNVQSVVMDSQDRLWLVDAGSMNFGPNIEGAPKLWGYDINTGRRIKEITFPTDVALKKTYLNDVRFDLSRGQGGTAYITDSGAGGIIVVDLASGQSWRHLTGHPSVKPTPGLQPTTEGGPFIQRKPNGEQMAPDIRSDGIALSPDSKTLYYTPLMSRDVYSVPTDLLADRNADPQKLAAAVKKIATKPSGNDGILCDAEGRIYTTDWEDNAIRRIDPRTGTAEVVVQDERLIWPDTLALHGDQLYITNNQLPRQPSFQGGQDQRKPPYSLMRIRITGSEKTAHAE